MDTFEVPAVRARDTLELFLRLGQRDVHAAFALATPLQQVLERKRRLTRAGVAFNQVNAIRCEAAAQNIVEATDPGGDGRFLGFHVHGACELFLRARNLAKRRSTAEPCQP